MTCCGGCKDIEQYSKITMREYIKKCAQLGHQLQIVHVLDLSNNKTGLGFDHGVMNLTTGENLMPGAFKQPE